MTNHTLFLTVNSILIINLSKPKIMSARSTLIEFNNITDYLLILTNSNLSHGVWNGGPATVIQPGAKGRVIGNNESNGFMTGDQGSLSYAVIGVDNNAPNKIASIGMNWDNPYTGSNGYSASCSAESLTLNYSGGSGDNSTITFDFSNS